MRSRHFVMGFSDPSYLLKCCNGVDNKVEQFICDTIYDSVTRHITRIFVLLVILETHSCYPKYHEKYDPMKILDLDTCIINTILLLRVPIL